MFNCGKTQIETVLKNKELILSLYESNALGSRVLLTRKSGLSHGRNDGGEDRTNANRHDIHAVAIYRDTEIVGHVPYNLAPRMSAFLMKTKHLQKSQAPKTTGELAMVRKSFVSLVSTVY